jgi:signal transduction histidine kinase
VENLPVHFARRMLPVAVAAGLVVAVVPPFSYRLVAWHQLAVQGRIYAQQMAGAVGRAAEEDLYLWRYNTPKILGAVAGYRGQRDIGSVVVRDCVGRVALSSTELGLGTGEAGPSGSARVVVGRGAVATIEVQMGTSEQRRILWALAAAALLLGGALALALYVFPTRVVRRQGRIVADTVSQLRAMEAQLRGLNLELADRVRAAVAEARELSERVVTLQEEERQRIARDLHDGVGQVVTALQIELRLAQGHPSTADAHLADAGRLAEEVLAEIRAAVFALRPTQLGVMGVEAALRSLVERFELQTGTPASFRATGELTRLPDGVVTCLLRILQEALTNISRHASAREVGVVIEAAAGSVRLQVADDGAGLHPDDPGRGWGLRGMMERAAFLGGKLEIQSAPGEGTLVEVTLPVDGTDG